MKTNTLFATGFCTIILCVWTLLGCGGGSRGTGTLSIEGRVLSSRGEPISEATVINNETGESAVTSSMGEFLLELERLSGTVSFTVETPSFTVTSSGGSEITKDTEVIEVAITVDTSAQRPKASQTVKIKKEKSGSSSSASSSSSSKASSSSSSSSSNSSKSSGGSSSSSSDDSGNGDSDDDSGDDSSSSSSQGSSSSSSQGEDDNQEVKVEGAIQGLTTSSLTVRETTFTVDSQTRFEGKRSLSEFSVGDEVEVRGRFRSGVLVADRIKFKD